MRKISSSKQLQLRNAAKKQLEQLEKINADKNSIEVIDLFKNKFIVCEMVYKVILAEHQKHRGKQMPKYLKIDMRQVPHALSFAGYTFDKNLLEILFGSERGKRREKKSVKDLRNDITHDMNEKTIREILERKEELFGYMDEFLSIIRTYDENVA